MKRKKILLVVYLMAALSSGNSKVPLTKLTLVSEDYTQKFTAFYDSSQRMNADESIRWQLWKKMVDFEATPPTAAGDSIARRFLDLAWPKYDSLMPYLHSGLSKRIFDRASGIVEKVADIMKPDSAFSIRIRTYVGGFEPNAFTTVSAKKIVTSVPVEIADNIRYPIMMHELVHAVHIGMGSFSGNWIRTIGTIVITEGLAMRVSQMLMPGKPDSAYTEYSSGWYRLALAKNEEILKDVRRAADSDSLNDIMRFTMGVGPALIEREAYYAGWVVVGYLLRHGMTAAEIARIPENKMPSVTIETIDSIFQMAQLKRP